ncbi:MAG: hypothetical protein ACXW1U_21225, partial [Methylobacter sp.]
MIQQRLNGTLYSVDCYGITDFIGLIGEHIDMQQMITQLAFAAQWKIAVKNIFEQADSDLFRLFFVVVNFMDLVVDCFRVAKI